MQLWLLILPTYKAPCVSTPFLYSSCCTPCCYLLQYNANDSKKQKRTRIILLEIQSPTVCLDWTPPYGSFRPIKIRDSVSRKTSLIPIPTNL